MEIKKLALFLAVVTSSSSFAQSTNLGAESTKDIFSKMSAISAADLALRSQVGSCKAAQPGTSGANYLYSLKYYDGTKWKVERFGYKMVIQSLPKSQVLALPNAQSSLNQNVIQKMMSGLKNTLLIPSAEAIQNPATLPMYNMPIYNQNDRESAKQYLGARVKILVNSSKCGTINFESFNQSVANMKGKVNFYLVNNVVQCTAGDFQKRIRNTVTCADEIIHSPLPKKACTFLYQIESTRSGRNAVVQSGVASLPLLSPMTAQLEEHFAVDAVLTANPDIALVASTADVIAAEHALPSSLVSLIDEKTISAATFNSLTSAEKADLVNLVATYGLVQSSSNHIKFSSQIASIVSSIQSTANTYALAQNLSVQIYAVPTTMEVSDHLNLQLAPITSITKKSFLYNLGCMTQMMAVAAPANFQSM
jgi:hypothetical protein